MKMTGWQTRLTFPVVPRDQWEFPTMPPESTTIQDGPSGKRMRLDGDSSVKGKEKEGVAKSEEPPVAKVPAKRKPRAKPKPKTPKAAAQSSNEQTSASASGEVSPATATQILNTNQTEDDELVYIKSEYKDEVMDTIMPDPDDQDFYCRTCNLQKHSRAAYRYHLQRVHKMKLTALQPLPFSVKAAEVRPETLPDVYDPYFYCRICKKRYKDVICYRRHCQNYHGIQLTRALSIPDPNIEPDPNDPLHYCKACNRSYEVRATYRDHLRRIHKMALEPACNPANLDRSKGFVCRFCNETFKEGKVYGAHLQANHQGKLEKR